MSNTVVSYNFLAALSETKRDLFKDVYVPFCKQALSQYCENGNKQGTDEDVRELIRKNFGLDVPTLMVRQLIRGVHDDLSRRELKDTGLELFENGHSFQLNRMTFANIEDKYQKSRREYQLLKKSFKDYQEEFGIEEEVPPLSAFINKNCAEVSSFFAGGDLNSSDIEDKSFLIHVDFLKHVEVQNHDLYKVIERLFMGSLIASYLESSVDLQEKFSDEVDYFIDTQIILRALGLQDEPETQPARDLLDLIKSTGGNIKVFDATINELNQVLDYAIEKFDQENPTTTINEACIRLDKKRSWLVTLNHNLEDQLNERFGFSITNISLSFKEEVKKTEDYEELKDRRNKSNAFHDVLCYRRVRYFRGGEIGSPKKANSWFVTPNKRLYKFNKEFSSEFSIGEIVNPEPLTALLWLRDVNKFEQDVRKTGLNEMISQTISEEVASRDLIISFEENLKAAPNVSTDQFQALLSTVAHESAKSISKLNSLLEEEEYETFENEATKIIERDRAKKQRYKNRFKEVVSERNNKTDKVKQESKRADQAESELLNLKIDNKIEDWRRPARYLAIPATIILPVLSMFLFLWDNTDWNFMTHLLEAIDSLESGTLKFISRTLIYVIPFGGTFYSAWVIYHYYYDQSKITEVRNNFRQDIREK